MSTTSTATTGAATSGTRTASAYTLSPAARMRLTADLDALGVERALRAAEPASMCGDVADVAELAARDMTLEHLDNRISRIQDLLELNRPSVEKSRGKTRHQTTAVAAVPDAVELGTRVTLRFGSEALTEEFVLGDLAERGADAEAITPSSPLGRALLNAAVGNTIEYSAPGGTLRATVEAVAPLD